MPELARNNSDFLFFYPCTGDKPAPKSLLLIHGWGFDQQVWHSALPFLQIHFDCYLLDVFRAPTQMALGGFDVDTALEQLFQSLLPSLPEKIVVLGWSLGGMLAMEFAVRYPDRCSHVITLASSLKWVADNNWPGMPQSEFRRFCQRLQRDPATTQTQFIALQLAGDCQAETLEPLVKQCADQAGLNSQQLQNGLALLDRLDLREAQFNMPVLHLLAENDALIGEATRLAIRQQQPEHHCQVYPRSGHAFWLASPALLAETVLQFACAESQQLQKRDVAA
ncbi:MAG: alpha/beta fold hydrolase, partial [Pseudomonadales bacterium]|nr:alpha/beta fold hydrolase [Pseudomonadales bacterium]